MTRVSGRYLIVDPEPHGSAEQQVELKPLHQPALRADLTRLLPQLDVHPANHANPINTRNFSASCRGPRLISTFSQTADL